MVQRRSFLKAAGIAGITTAAGCLGDGSDSGSDGGTTSGSGGGGTTSGSGGGGTEPVKIGAVMALSGPFARTGEENRRGLEVATEYLGGEIAGNEFELIIEDGESDPNASIQAARTLIEDEDVDAIIGPVSSGNSIAVMQYMKEEGQVPHLLTTASSVEARENPENCNEYGFFIWPSNRHLAPTGTQFIQELPNHVDRDIDTSKVHFVSWDYALGQNGLELAREAMNEVGGEVVGSTLVPIGETDWSSYISEISNSEADVVTGVLTWGAAAQFIPQANSFGLPEEKVIMMNSGKPIGQFAASTMASEVVQDGWFGTHFYNPQLDNEPNNEFKSLYGELDSSLLPNSTAGASFELMRALATAVENTGSTATDDIISGLEGLEWESVFGDIMFREEDHQAALDFYGGRRVAGDGDVPDVEVLAEYPDVIPGARCSL
ncbi:ABC transporter substrate-binding protein [Halobellus clavatus]|uniref:Amino acid/amide ABC transporter substrate-binding protein, HAAT family n=1 Tax=Halobellus clavatus TaxID=660517 RepID=A0A1H3FVE1_9EURY|nr:ABC transporter substrate-binding protein [Halobellus clavatus]SDX94900.1 amino acid/amide ABC transporter substrate-binding protein, HAAT family [Halobellus clavatus]